MSLGAKAIRALVGVAVLLVLFFTVTNWVSDYRDATGGSREGTSTVEPTSTPGSGEATSSGGEGATPPGGTGKVATVLVDGLNFRSGPSRDSGLIRGLDAGEKLDVIGEKDGWLQVRDASGATGYISASSQYSRVE